MHAKLIRPSLCCLGMHEQKAGYGNDQDSHLSPWNNVKAGGAYLW